MSGQNGHVTGFLEKGLTDVYDFWYQIKGGEYLGPHVSIFSLGSIGSMSHQFLVEEMCCHLLRNLGTYAGKSLAKEKRKCNFTINICSPSTSW